MPTAAQSQPQSSPPTYKIVEIPALTPTSSAPILASCTAAAANDQGVVVGQCDMSCNCRDPEPQGFERAWMYDGNSGSLTELSFDPSELGAVATDISNRGIITGDEYASNFQEYPGFWTATGGAMLLNGQDGQLVSSVFAIAVNNSGDIVGYTGNSNETNAVLWSGVNHSMTILPAPACNQCGSTNDFPTAINDGDTIVGDGPVNVASSPTGVGNTALEWQGGTVTSLGSLNGSGGSVAYGINNNGDVVGGSEIAPGYNPPEHAFLYHNGAMNDLGTLPGQVNSYATSISNSGEIVGNSEQGPPFLYVNGKMYNLISLINPTDPLAGVVQLQATTSINSSGWITANGIDTRDAEPDNARAFLLVPSR